MTKTVFRFCFVAALLVAGGCDPSADDRHAGASKAANVAGTAEMPRGDAAIAGTDRIWESEVRTDEATASRRRSELQAQIEAAQSRRGSLQQERARVLAVVQSHQNDSEQKLAAFKAQFKALQEGGAEGTRSSRSRDQFAERARNELEAALSMDQEYQAQLGEIDGKLSETDMRLSELQTELGTLQSRQ